MLTPRTILICVGSELLRGKVNTHASTIARALAGIGLELNAERTLGDEFAELREAIAEARTRFDIVIVTGGLGPTFDDISREAAADAFRRPLVFSRSLEKNIRAKFRRAKYRMPPMNLRQAQVIQGAAPIANSVGTAPGQWLVYGGGRRVLMLLPGPPSELKPMLGAYVLPQLAKRFPRSAQAEAHLHFVGIPESRVDQAIRPIIAPYEKTAARFTILAHLGLVDLDVFVSGGTKGAARRTLSTIVARLRKRMGAAFYGMDDDYPLEKVVGALFRRKSWTLALAESCTGGLLAAKLTEVPGSSDFLLGGVVSYANSSKTGLLAVPQALLKRRGAVSAETACAMAEGARGRFGSHWGVGITGIAGPTGGTRAKNVGLVYVALAGRRGVRARRFQFNGSRETIRQRTVTAALDWLRQLD